MTVNGIDIVLELEFTMTFTVGKDCISNRHSAIYHD